MNKLNKILLNILGLFLLSSGNIISMESSTKENPLHFEQKVTQSILNYFKRFNRDKKLTYNSLQHSDVIIKLGSTTLQTKKEINNYVNALNEFISNFSQLDFIQQIQYLLKNMMEHKQSKTNIENLIIYFVSNIKYLRIQYYIPENIDILFGSFSKNVESLLKFFFII